MPPTLFAMAGTLTGAGAVTLLYFKWRGDVRRRWAVAAAWVAMAGSVALWVAACHPDVSVPCAILTMMLAALALVLKGADLKAVMQFPSVRRLRPEAAVRLSWSAAAVRTVSAVVAAPVVGMILGLLIWTVAPGHASTRFVWAVVVFLAAFAALQVWGLSATRPWRALGLIVAVGAAAAIPVTLVLR